MKLSKSKMSAPKPITLLHLSDLQFGRSHRFGPLSSPAPDGSLESLFSRLQEDLERLRQDEEVSPDLVAVTGDLAEWGKKSEFDDVFTFLERLAGLLKLTRDRILVVPGNHDINRQACESYFLSRASDEQPPKEPYWPKFRHYAAFFERYYAGLSGIRFTEEEPWSLFELPELKVVVAGLNSTMKESHRPEDHYGWVGEQQLRWFAEKLRSYKDRGWLRIGLVHHNVQRQATDDTENLRDAGALGRILGGELNLLLHGHTHEGHIAWLGSRTPILSTGSAAVIPEARPKEVPNQYQVLRIHPDRLWRGTRMYAPDQHRWIGDPRSSPNGDKCFHEEPIQFDHVSETFGGRSAEETVRTDHLASMLASYRAHIATAYQRQTLHDLSTRAEDQGLPAGLALLEIFVPQAVSLALPARDLAQAPADDAWDNTLAEEEAESLSPLESPPLTIEQALLDPAQPWAVLLGAPGAGKTSLTRWLCLKLCAPGESLPSLSRELVPVRVELRRFDERYRAATAAGHTYDFFDYLDQEHTEKALALRGGPLRELAANGRLLWLFDGLDEVPDRSARKRYAEMIMGRRAAEPSRGVVTSRIVGAQPVLPVFQSANVPVCTLLDFDEPRIHQFLSQWHDKALQGSSEDRSARKERLERVLARSRPVRELCKNPLLLTLIALINRGGELPRRRHELYRRAAELMTSQWEANKQLAFTPEVPFESEDKLEYLKELAWWMLFDSPEAPQTLIQEEELLKFTSGFLTTRYNRTPEQARRQSEALLGHLRERNYILARVGEQLYGFVHRTFLEYFVADALRSRFAGRQLDLSVLVNTFRQGWNEDAWQEVFTLLCGMLAENQPSHVMQLLQGVLPHIEVAHFLHLDFAGFAVRCLAEVRHLDQAPIRTFMQRLADFARYELGQARFFNDTDGFTDSIHLIGPRWPERESWVHWTQQVAKQRSMLRALASRCVFETTPPEQHPELLVRTLQEEWSALVAHYLLTKVPLPEDRVRALLTQGEDGTRCMIAKGLLFTRALSAPYQGRLEAEAVATLKVLVERAPLPMHKSRAAVTLVQYEATPLVRQTLLECIRSPSAKNVDIAESIGALGYLARTDSQLATELQDWPRHRGKQNMLQAVADAMVLAGLPMQAAQCFLDWAEHFPGYGVRKQVETRLIGLALQSSPVIDLLEQIRVKASSQLLQRLASHVCEEVSIRRQLKELASAPAPRVFEVLESPTTTHVLRERLVSSISRGTFGSSGADGLWEDERFLEVLRAMEAADSPPMSRLVAAVARWFLALTPEKEVLLQACRDIIATSSDDEKTRLRAASWLGDEGTAVIEALAREAADEHVRIEASTRLDTLRLRAALQTVPAGHAL
ncbi:MAG TPA: metallophosphoesterase [Myxococcaceae bacterium]|nr:metallophosphoesterase [Myxococcaceae bacterium]